MSGTSIEKDSENATLADLEKALYEFGRAASYDGGRHEGEPTKRLAQTIFALLRHDDRPT